MDLYDIHDGLRNLLDDLGVHEPPLDDPNLEDFDALVDDLSHLLDHAVAAYRQRPVRQGPTR